MEIYSDIYGTFDTDDLDFDGYEDIETVFSDLDDITAFLLDEDTEIDIEMVMNFKGMTYDAFEKQIGTDRLDEFFVKNMDISTIPSERLMAACQATGNFNRDEIEDGDVDANLVRIDSDMYYVVTEDEAEDEFEEQIKRDWDDMGLDLILDENDEIKYDFMDCIDESWFKDALNEMSESYCHDVKHESASSSEFVNRLHQEMVEDGFMDYPEWPEEPDESDFEYEREDFDDTEYVENEPEEDDFETEEEYNEAHEQWDEEYNNAYDEWEAEQDRLEEEAQEEYDTAYEEWENEYESYRQELEDEVENNIYDYAERRIADVNDPVQEYIDQLGEESFMTVIKNNEYLIDDDCVIDELKRQSSMADILSPYSEEWTESVTFEDQQYTFNIYKVD